MKKTLKRTIACLLTVLMVVCSLPFTAFAEPYQYKYLADGKGYNDLGYTGYDVYNDLQDQPYSYLNSGTQARLDGTNGYLCQWHDWNPTFGIIVQDIGNSKAGDFTAIRNDKDAIYKGNYDNAASTVINPAELKTGQRIAVSIEVGGVEVLNAAQFKAKFDTNYLVPGGYRSATAWMKNNATAINNGLLNSVESNFPEFTPSTTYDLNGALVCYAGALVDETGAASVYIGDVRDVLGGKYGMLIATFCFEVMQDCDLKDVLNINTSHIGNNFIEPWAEDDARAYCSDHEDRYCLGGYEGYIEPAVIWDSYSNGAATTVDYTYTMADGTSTTVTVNAGETPTAPANTAAKCEHIADTQTHKTTTYTWPAFDAAVTEYTEVATEETANCDYNIDHTVAPTYETTGTDTYTCKVCGDSYTVEVPKLTCDHTWGEWTVTKPATCKETGIETRTCSTCGETETRDIALADHTWDEGVVTTAPTCTKEGVKTFTCSVCGETKTEAVAVVDHQWNDGEVTTPATCVAEGVKTFTCAVGGETRTEAIPVDAANHAGPTEVQNAKPATCTAEGYTGDTVCTACGVTVTAGEVIAKLAHTAGTPVQENVVEATYETEGSYDLVTRCTVCNEVIATEHKTTPVLEGGIAITVKASALGTATIADKEVTTADVTKIVAPKSDVVLTATPAEGATFVGWNANGKMVSTEATITVKALNVVTYEPIFETSAADKFTVVFTDKYGNVISTQTVAAGTDIAEPVAPAIAGHTFAGWSMTEEEIDALTASATITAVYEKDAEAMYTVTATDGATVNGEASVQVPYDTAVTVTAADAKAWKIGDAIVAYGDTYTFYVGADVTVTPVFTLETAQAPTVTAVSTSEVTAANGLKAGSFLATRSMTDDCTYVNAGYIYGLNVADSNIELGDVDGSAVKVKYCATAAEQFALTYGVTAQAGTITARAFLAYVDAEGNTQVVYAAPQTYTYSK